MKKLLLIGLLTAATAVLAAPAYNGWEKVTQPGGEEIEVQMQGDEFVHWYKTKDGKILIYNEDTASYDHTKLENGHLVSTGKQYSKNEENRTTEGPQLKAPQKSNIEEEVQRMRSERIKARPSRKELDHKLQFMND